MKLYDLAIEFDSLFDQLTGQAETDLTEDEIKVQLDLFAGQFEFKAINIATMILELKGNAGLLKAEEDRLARKRKALENKREWLENYVISNMKLSGITTVKGGVLSAILRDNPPSVQVTSAKDIPALFMRTIPEYEEPDKKAILDNFRKTGEIPPGCEISRGQRLEIK